MHVIIGLVLLAGALWLLSVTVAFTSASILIVGDSLGHASSLFGVVDPIIGWAIAGALFGGLVGATTGLRRAGRKLSGTSAFLIGVLLAATMMGADRYSAGETATVGVPESSSTQYVRVTADRVNLRTAPHTSAPVLTTLLARATLRVVRADVTGWYEVDATSGGRTLTGWVSAKNVSRPAALVTATAVVRPVGSIPRDPTFTATGPLQNTDSVDAERSVGADSAKQAQVDPLADLTASVEAGWAAESLYISSESSDAYLSSARRLRDVLATIGAYDRTHGVSPGVLRLLAGTNQRLARTIKACQDDNATRAPASQLVCPSVTDP